MEPPTFLFSENFYIGIQFNDVVTKDDPNVVLLYERECNHGMIEDERVYIKTCYGNGKGDLGRKGIY